ncbi:MAG: 50S ribosomal protein L18 [Candidatus Colwellbacteria bacterium CG10_big_fil_rev_8_21_14_0_10_41_28]|uniref:Large ribosomal subunit protein uL18 n=1 Tax=Candidatus Colwellbacteria bacterium CG10_big_fil_rev_8_21_14_0_10_41_28 TaxID=1974539 RepID=A0A2H0VJF7_9BACT|nr:MAG: 50S ribosomal protein L18 [Candidatus Colwellbacteria bacterium CG10_big_fil_rev_8_21_14_0_10_41_28]
MNREQKKTQLNRFLRSRRTRAKVMGTKERPRISVYKSNRSLEVQLIDDTEGKTLVHVKNDDSGTKSEQATKVGQELAKKALDAGVKKAIFDKRSYKYHGRVKAVAEAAREAGLDF